MALPDRSNGEELARWLRERPREVSLAIAARAILEVWA
jgi:hypothetical protein